MKLKLTVENMYLIRWFVDVSYNVHWGSREHNGAMMTFRKGDIINNSNKKKLNVKSSNEGGLAAPHDQLPDIMHPLYFIEAQGYIIDKKL